MNKCIALFILCLVVSSCASNKHEQLKKELVRQEERFSYTDKNGQFIVKLSSGFKKKENTFFSKRILEIPNKDTDNILEQSVALSDVGSIKKKENILRPKLSHYNVWFEGKKYFTELKINSEKKAIEIRMVSPESQWNGTKQVKLPSTKTLYCFFTQTIECVKTSGVLEKLIKKKTKAMNFYVIWEGYPYLSETYTDFPKEVFSKAQLEYDGKTKEGEHRLSLRVAGQSIFFVIDQNEQMKKMFWVSQGISMVSRLVKKTEIGEELSEIGGSLE